MAPATNDQLSSLRRPLRRRSYQEACTDDSEGRSSVQRQHVRVLVRRLSTDLGTHSYNDLSNNMSSDAGNGPLLHGEDHMSFDSSSSSISVY